MPNTDTNAIAIDDKLRALLLKVRKEAWSSFSAAQWQAVLEAMEFTYAVTERDGRKVMAVEIVAPNGDKIAIRKEGWAKCLLFYDLMSWGRENSMSEMASRVLGMPTVAEEDGLREYRARDWTHTGTCGVCSQNVKMEGIGKGTTLVLHGYLRPGDGATHGECFGRGYEPHELSPKAAADFLAQRLIPDRDGAAIYLRRLRTGEVTRIQTDMPSRHNNWKATYVSKGEPHWERVLREETGSSEHRLKMAQRFVDTFTAKVASWKPDELPEIKMKKLHEPVASDKRGA